MDKLGLLVVGGSSFICCWLHSVAGVVHVDDAIRRPFVEPLSIFCSKHLEISFGLSVPILSCYFVGLTIHLYMSVRLRQFTRLVQEFPFEFTYTQLGRCTQWNEFTTLQTKIAATIDTNFALLGAILKKSQKQSSIKSHGKKIQLLGQ